ncbi:MAG: glycosyltransferase family 2 protein [Bacteroidaceae bacterium]|nr:glycosyltransferase family 2 protein [Bacteroidaceae bacterium]
MVCAVIPTYNNQETILRVIQDVKAYLRDVIVVNDGCTDHTPELLSSVPDIHVVSYSHNHGKGYALKQGFLEAHRLGFSHVVTLDADGQHRATDIPLLLKTHAENLSALIVGSRNLTADNMPRSNTFANRFSNFWFYIQTLQYLPDTQTGYRLYPLASFTNLWWMTDKYEAELELLVMAAWKGVQLISIPIQVYYPSASERVSHFRPFKDFARISALNTVLCVMAVVYGYPRMLLKKLCR